VDNPKPTDEPRLTVNFRNVKEDLPGIHLQSMSKVHDHLSDPRHFCFMQADLKHAYYSVSLDPACRHYFTFYVSGLGQLQPTRMPQGSVSAAFTLTELTTILLGAIPPPQPEPSLLHGLPDGDPSDPVPCVFYQDDIFGGHSSFEAQFEFLRDQLLPRIAWGELRISFKKLRLFQDTIQALGIRHTIGGRLNIVDTRIAKIIRWPTPKNVSGIRGFLGATSICRRWVKNFSELARPITSLTSKWTWRWSDCEQLSFELLRTKCATVLAMHGIDWSITVHFFTDASKFYAGLIIVQYQVITPSGKPVAVPILFDSFPFTMAERKYPTYKRELCSLVRFASKYDYFLRDPHRPGVIHTDHKPLTSFLKSDCHDGIYSTWAARLSPLCVSIEYIPGSRNRVADGLSRTIFSDDASDTPISKAL
jgi:RNase H-like domain found in reverse transcriptase